MRIRLTFLLFFSISFCFGQTTVKIISWNLKDFGKSKTDQEISMIASIVKTHDILAIQEVVAGYGGPQAVARLADELNRKGERWNYVLSDVTSNKSVYKAERYAFFWKNSKLKIIGKPWLESKYGVLIEREPFYAKFATGKKTFTIVSFHAITKSQHPESEIKYFKFLPSSYPKDNLIFCGDFNVPQSHSVFNPLKEMGYVPALKDQKTTLRQRCLMGDCLASEFDNFFHSSVRISMKSSGVLHFYRLFTDIKLARKLSDHTPIFAIYKL